MSLMREYTFDSLIIASDSGRALIAGYCLAKRTRLPYSVIYFDPYAGNHFGWMLDSVAMAFEPRLLRNALHVIVCGDALEESIRKRVQREYVQLPISVNVPEKPPDFTQHHPRVFRILYTGAVYWAQVDTIRSFVEATRTLEGVEFLVYSEQKEEELAQMGVKGRHVRYGFLAKRELMKLQNRVDLLYLPLSFSKEFRRVVKVATASKIFEYMTSGRPILVHAPAYASIAKYAERENFAQVITSTDPDQIRLNLIKLMRESGHRKRLAENAWRIVCKYHNAKQNSKLLNDVLFIT
jgi:glycosyltransferase involved in cell wall biosynthesis